MLSYRRVVVQEQGRAARKLEASIKRQNFDNAKSGRDGSHMHRSPGYCVAVKELKFKLLYYGNMVNNMVSGVW